MADNITVDANVTSFSWAVDSAIRSETASNLGESRLHSFASIVNSPIRSWTASILRTSCVQSFASVVNSAIKSWTASNLNSGTSHSPVTVDKGLSSIGADLGTSPTHGFASTVDNAIRSSSSGGGADLGTGVDNNVMSNATGVVEGYPSFTLAELVEATDNFSFDNMVGAGSFGVVYRGKLVDGREVAIKRGGNWTKENNGCNHSLALAFLCSLHHKNLVGLVGLCEEKDERLLVYEYMKNGSLYDHLHDKRSSVLNSWKMRINIALNASRGIQYLHHHPDRYTCHGDIKSSNILFDATWTARVSDIDLSFWIPKPYGEHDERVTGSPGYEDPDTKSYGPKLKSESDVYAFGVVLFKLLTGKIALHIEHNLVRFLTLDNLAEILDPRVGPPNVNEAEALKLVAKTAIRCVEYLGNYRPKMADIVVNLERALAICDRVLILRRRDINYPVRHPSM